MAVDAEGERAEDTNNKNSAGILGRIWGAFRLLIDAQIASAKREASQDASRMLGGLALAALGASLFMTGLVLVQVALVFWVQARFALAWPVALLAVAGGNVLVAMVLFGAARMKLAPPVLVETRAMMKRVAGVITGDS